MISATFDQHNPNWSTQNGHNQFFLEAEQRYANDILRSKGFITLNEVFDMLDLEKTEEGALTGWVGDVEVDFGITGGIGTPIDLNFNTNSANVFRDRDKK